MDLNQSSTDSDCGPDWDHRISSTAGSLSTCFSTLVPQKTGRESDRRLRAMRSIRTTLR